MTCKCGRSVKVGQIHRYQLWGRTEGPSQTVVCLLVDSIRGLAAADVRGSAVVRAVKSVRQGKITENATIRFRRKRLVGARVETHPAISSKQEWASHCFIGNDVYPYRK